MNIIHPHKEMYSDRILNTIEDSTDKLQIHRHNIFYGGNSANKEKEKRAMFTGGIFVSASARLPEDIFIQHMRRHH